MTNSFFRTVATVALTLAASGTFLLGALAPAETGMARGTAAARIVA